MQNSAANPSFLSAHAYSYFPSAYVFLSLAHSHFLELLRSGL